MPVIAYLDNPSTILLVLTEEEVQDLAAHDKVLDFEDEFSDGSPIELKMVIAMMDSAVINGRLTDRMVEAVAAGAILFLIKDDMLVSARMGVTSTMIPYPFKNFHLGLRVVKDNAELQDLIAKHSDETTITEDHMGILPFHLN